MKTQDIIEQIKSNIERELSKDEQQLIYKKVTEWVIANKDDVEPQDDKFIEAFMQMVLNKARHYYHLLSQSEYERRSPKELDDAMLNSKNDVTFFNFITLMDRDKYFVNKVHNKRDTRQFWYGLLFIVILLAAAAIYYTVKMNKQVDAVEKQATTMLLTPTKWSENIFVSPRKW